MNTSEAQAALIARGYSLGPTGADGIWGRLSRVACSVFQRRCGLVAAGELDGATIAALRATVAPKALYRAKFFADQPIATRARSRSIANKKSPAWRGGASVPGARPR